jgi:hypothetical protein
MHENRERSLPDVEELCRLTQKAGINAAEV